MTKLAADKMMIKAKGPVWHKKQKDADIIPRGLTGLDREAQWSKSQADGWVYGHGSFCVCGLMQPVLLNFVWMPNAGDEAKVMGKFARRYQQSIDLIAMDSKADKTGLYFDLKQRGIRLLTSPRKKLGKKPTKKRQQMYQFLVSKQCKRLYKHRSISVEPLQGLIADIFDLQICHMRTKQNNRWMFAAMGIAIQIAQLDNWRQGISIWKIKSKVLGV
jgi:hypothetical protein